MKIGILGAGGIGSYYAGMLSRAGHSVRLIARGDHLAAINANGLEVRTPDERFVTHPMATDDGDALRDCEHVIVSVKGYSLPEVGTSLVNAARSGAAIVSLLNGVDVAERMQSLGVPRESIVGGLVQASLVRTSPGVVERRSAFDRVVLGELDRVPRERTTQLVQAMAAAGSSATESADIGHDLWRKLAAIVTMNVACGLPRKPMGAMLSTERGRQLIADNVHEIVMVSRAAGTPLSDEDEARLVRDLLAIAPGIQPSFLADLERGGPTELDLLVGTVVRLAREHNVATPIHDLAFTVFEAASASRLTG